MEVEDLKKNLKKRRWRLDNLYFIINKDGKKEKFNMNLVQEELENDKHPKKVIVKARQRGVTTYKCISDLDYALFREHYQGDLIADTMPNAVKIFGKIKFAWENLPKALRAQYHIHNFNEKNIIISLKTTPHAKRQVSISVTTRGQTSQDLHISELGRIDAKFPERSEEIKSGALESVGKDQNITVESTAMGKSGLFWNLTKQGIKNQDKKILSNMDWKLFFFPWWTNQEYSDDTPVEIPKHLLEYFKELELIDIKLSVSQKYWYTRKEETQGWLMKREYPSYILEAFEGVSEGTVYLHQLGAMVKDRRYKEFDYVPELPVYTFWDIGFGDYMAILFVQGGLGEVRILDYYENNRQTWDHYVHVLTKDKPYKYGGHWLPHDGRKHSLESGKDARQILTGLGLSNVHIDEIGGIQIGLQEVRRMFPFLWINKGNPGARLYYDRLNKYRYPWNDKMNEWGTDPIHDKNSHASDTLRGLAKNINKISRQFPMSAPVNQTNAYGGIDPSDPFDLM